MVKRRRTKQGSTIKKTKLAGAPAAGVAVRGRPPRLAHLVPGSPTNQRRERALASPLDPPPPDLSDGAPADLPELEILGPDVLCLPNPEWLPHRLTVTGPRADLADFREAARGPGHIAWTSDTGRDCEAWTAQLLALSARRPDLSAESARGIAREMREMIEALDLAAADASGDRDCPFDLNALVPLPADLRRRGPDDPAVATWLWQNWGTTWMLRRVQEIPPGPAAILLPEGHDALCVEFWSADWTPWHALTAVRARWPALGLHLKLLPVGE
jgi:hypothetical protein